MLKTICLAFRGCENTSGGLSSKINAKKDMEAPFAVFRMFAEKLGLNINWENLDYEQRKYNKTFDYTKLYGKWNTCSLR